MSDPRPVSTLSCPHCHCDITPVVDDLILIPLPDAVVYLCMPSLGAMYTALWRFKDQLSPPQYAYDKDHRKHRLLSLNDLRVLRSHKRMSLRGVMRALTSGKL
jgi:hypothetical protein